ncbi:hypothetical protein IPM62_00460 [Candidatus Woesebacteria bacterium]|nr:MAG: hypothetical protein IPM62_00460 [Candidatus Woesebacteria bacterium]
MIVASTLYALENTATPDIAKNYTFGQFISGLVRAGIAIGIMVAAMILLFMLMTGGIGWITSSGERGKIEVAKKKIYAGLTGMAVLLLLFIIIQLIQAAFDVSLVNINLENFFLNTP